MPVARFPRCFLSCSFHESDRKILEWFRSLLTALEFDVKTGDSPEPKAPPEKVRDLIRGSDVVVALLTRRDKVEGTDLWRAPDWIQNELGMTYDAGKPVAVFVEEGVGTSGLTPLITQYETFDPANLSESAPRIVRYLVTLRNAVTTRPTTLDEPSLVRALAMELMQRLTELSEVESSLELNMWNLTYLYARITGRFYVLPADVQQHVGDAYDALDEMMGLVNNAKTSLHPTSLMSAYKRGKDQKPPEGSDDKSKAALAKVAEFKPQAMARVAAAAFALVVLGWPEAAQIFQGMAERAQQLKSDKATS